MNAEEKIKKIKRDLSNESALLDSLRYKEAYLNDLKIMRFINDAYEPELKFYKLSVAANLSTCLYAMERYEEAFELALNVLQEAKVEYGDTDDLVLQIMDNLMRIAIEIDGKEELAKEIAFSLKEKQAEKYGLDDERCRKTHIFINRCRAEIESQGPACDEFVKEIIGFRYCGRSSYVYDYYMDRDRRFTVTTTIGANPLTVIKWNEGRLESKHMEVSGIQDGLVRHVYDKKSHRPAFSLLYFHDLNFYTITGAFPDIMVEEADEYQYRFIRNHAIIGVIKMINRNDWVPEVEGKDYLPFYQFILCEKKISTFEVVAMLSFLMLRFA